jgi:hypothetical protein
VRHRKFFEDRQKLPEKIANCDSIGDAAAHSDEVYLDLLGRTITVHWNYHAILMVAVWFVLVPICIITISVRDDSA